MSRPLDRCYLVWARAELNGKSSWHGRIPRRACDHILDYAKREVDGTRPQVQVTRPWSLIVLLPSGAAKLTIEGTSLHARRYYTFPSVDQAQKHAQTWCRRRFRYQEIDQ